VFIEASAKDGKNVLEAVSELSRYVPDNYYFMFQTIIISSTSCNFLHFQCGYCNMAGSLLYFIL